MRLLTLRTVLVATDLTPTSDAALDSAARLATAAGATLHVAHAAPPSHEIIAQTGRRAEYVHEVDAALRRAHVKEDGRQVHVLNGDPPAAISSLADRIDANVIVLGQRRAGTALRAGRPVGSTAYAVITRTATPCLVIRRPLVLPLRRALVAIDCSESSPGTLLVALSWTSALRSRASDVGEPILTVLHVDTGPGAAGDDPSSRRNVDHELEALRQSAGRWAGVTMHGVTEASDEPVGTIVNHAMQHDVELVVLGTRGLSGEGAELGSISAAVTLQLDVPVLLVPPAIWRNYGKDLDRS
jgi:nucleotide-binding universal stress UspA family protein